MALDQRCRTSSRDGPVVGAAALRDFDPARGARALSCRARGARARSAAGRRSSRSCRARSRGAAIPLRLYRGAAAAAGGKLPALVYFHGGGWVIGDLDTHDSLCRHLANAARLHRRLGRLPPRSRAQIPGRRRGLLRRHLLGRRRRLRRSASTATRLAVGGDSAGGNLAAVVSLLARDRGAPKLCHQLLLYPAVDCAMTHPSHDRFAEGFLLTRATMRWFYGHYLQGPQDVADWRASPLRARRALRGRSRAGADRRQRRAERRGRSLCPPAAGAWRRRWSCATSPTRSTAF